MRLSALIPGAWITVCWIEMDGLLGNPVHYRDTRTDGMMDRTFRKVGKQEIYDRTGLAFLSFNTLYQLAAQVNSDDECLKIAQNMLFMPDLFSYFPDRENGL